MKVDKHIRALQQYADGLYSKRFMTFTTKLWELGERYLPQVSWEVGSLSSQKQVLAQNRPLFSHHTPQIHLKWMQEVLADIRTLVTSMYDLDQQTADELNTLDFTALTSDDLQDAVLNHEKVVSSVCARLQIDEQSAVASATALIVVAALRIFASAAAQKVDIDLQSVELPAYQTCPVCGQPPALATVRPAIGHDGGHRFLYCSSCETVWHFPRIRCAHCGETNPHQLRYVHKDDDQLHQLHLCVTCGHVTPTIMQEHRPTKYLYSPRVEELYGTHLAHAFVSSQETKSYFEDTPKTDANA